MTDTIINVSSLSFGYAGSDGLVLEDITFDIKKGEVALIIGASGSGKTTLLKMLDKSMIPEGRLSGKAEYYGRQISSLRDCLRCNPEKIRDGTGSGICIWRQYE